MKTLTFTETNNVSGEYLCYCEGEDGCNLVAAGAEDCDTCATICG